MGGLLAPLVCTRDHIGDMVGWIQEGHYVHLYRDDDDGGRQSFFHKCQGGNHQDVESYLAEHWVVAIDFTALPELFDLSLLEIPSLIRQGTCTCHLKERVSTFERIPHLEKLSVPCTQEQGRGIWNVITRLTAAMMRALGAKRVLQK